MAHNRDEVTNNRVGQPKPVQEEQRTSDNGDNRAQKSYADVLKQEIGNHGQKEAHTSDGISPNSLSKMAFIVSEEEMQWLQDCY
ncbi:hypothetical protein Ancab_014260, partial [Ancistrocladus abbreviatus]